MKKLQFLFLIVASLIAGQIFSQNVPATMNYQGKIMDNDGNPVNQQLPIEFTIYDAAGGGTNLWSEIHEDVEIVDGIFNVLLGSVNDFPEGMFENPGLYLGINVNNDGEMSPRNMLSSVPFAIKSNGAGDNDWTIDGDDIYHENGYVGVGTNDPSVKLDVAGGQICVSGKGAPDNGTSLELAYNSVYGRGEVLAYDRSANEYKDLRLDGATIFMNASSAAGNVSIGTSENEGRLNINNATLAGPVLYLEGGSADEGDIAWKSSEHLHIGSWDKETNEFSNVMTLFNNHQMRIYDDEGAKKLEFVCTETGADGAQLTLYDSEGNPAIVLDAEHGGQAGNPARIQTETLEITGGSDLAEPFNISHEGIEKGMLVSIDPENPGMVKLSTKAYDHCVAGISSGANNISPGLILKQEGSIADGEVPVALSGRVYCMVDASYGKIKPGDLLTSSNTPGHAMKAKSKRKSQGAIIGKAMTGLSEGTGYVLVLVSLQ